MKKTHLFMATFVGICCFAYTPVHASELTSEHKSQLQEELKQLAIKQSNLLAKYENTPTLAKVQKHNVHSQIEATNEEIKVVQQQLEQEEQTLKKQEETRKAEEQRKAQEEALTKTKQAIASQTPVVGHVDIAYNNATQWATYPWGQCTWGVKTMYPNVVGNYWGNAKQWGASARAAGYQVGTTPVPGAIISWTDSAYGHVAVVTDVAADGRIQVLEANYAGNAYAADPRGIGNYRGWFNPDRQGSHVYIYPNL